MGVTGRTEGDPLMTIPCLALLVTGCLGWDSAFYSQRLIQEAATHTWSLYTDGPLEGHCSATG